MLFELAILKMLQGSVLQDGTFAHKPGQQKAVIKHVIKQKPLVKLICVYVKIYVAPMKVISGEYALKSLNNLSVLPGFSSRKV